MVYWLQLIGNNSYHTQVIANTAYSLIILDTTPRGSKKQTRLNIFLDYAPPASFQTIWLARQWPDFKARGLG